jgi:uncharacterized protein (TIGR03435 family)
MKVLLFLAAGLMFAVSPRVNAQDVSGSVSGKRPAFEVATIKPVDPNAMRMVGITVYPEGRIVIRSSSLKGLICTAFNVSGWQVSGNGEMDKPLYDVEGKAPEPSQKEPFNTQHSIWTIEDERLREMLQTLLIDRFQLKFHRETKTGTVYLLQQDGKTPRLQATKEKGGSPYSGNIGAASGRGWMIHDTSMPQLANHLSMYILHRPVIDKTGLDGYFDFESKTILTDEDFRSPGFSEALLSVLPEMGLKVQKTTGPVEGFVVDHVELPPEN